METNKKIDSPFSGIPSRQRQNKPTNKEEELGEGLPFEPEPIEKLQARYYAALEKLWVPAPDMEDRPGLHRTHTFDFEDGWRMLVSRDKIGNSEINHISASYYSEIPLKIGILEMIQIIIDKWRQLSRKSLNEHLHLMGITGGGVSHFFECDGDAHDEGDSKKH